MSYNSEECEKTLLEMRILLRQAIAIMEYKRWLAQQRKGVVQK